jgi:hypothetical protein
MPMSFAICHLSFVIGRAQLLASSPTPSQSEPGALLINGHSCAPVDEVRICDPKTEVAVLTIWPDGAVSICRSGPHPEHFFHASDQ